MITKEELVSLGVLRRTQTQDLPAFVFVLRDGLFVPYRSSDISELIGNEIFVRRCDVAEDEEELFTWQDLVGYTIEDTEDGTIGVIGAVDETTINTLAILTDDRMIPLHEDFILEIDEDAHVLHVHLPFRL